MTLKTDINVEAYVFIIFYLERHGRLPFQTHF